MTLASIAPNALLVGLAAWSLWILYPHLGHDVATASIIALGASITLGFLGRIRPARWLDGLVVLTLGAGFLSPALFLANVGVVPLYLFVALVIMTYQMLSFRTTIAPLRPSFAEDEAVVRGLRTVFLSVVQRGMIVATFVFILSLVVSVVASGFVIGLTSEVTAFLLALILLVIIVVLATSVQRPSA